MLNYSEINNKTKLDLNTLFRYYWYKYIKKIKTQNSPIIIVGCGHSGTSITLAILGAHSKIHAIPYESWFLHDKVDTNKFIENFNIVSIANGKERWVEKTPKNIYYLDKVIKSYPNIKILYIIRDGRDVAVSIKNRFGDIERGIQRWVKDNSFGLQYINHKNLYAFKYEDLVDNFEQTMKKIFMFIGEEYEDDIKNYHKKTIKYYSNDLTKPPSGFGKHHEQFRNWQINQPLFDGRGHWKSLTSQELALVEKIGGELLRKFEYI